MYKMDFREFTEKIVEEIPEYLLQYDIANVEINKVLKNNTIELTGMTIRLKDEYIAPNIYLDYYYQEYLNEAQIEDILSNISREYTEARQNAGSLGIFSQGYPDLSEAAPNLFIKVVNYDRNKEFLKNCVHERYMDLALTVRCLVKSDDSGIASTHVRYQELENWNVSRAEIMQIAKDNTRHLFPPVCERMDAMLAGMIQDEDMPELDTPGLYVLTNDRGINGAVNIIYEDIAGEISKKLGNKDLYILPSSIHEILFMAVEPYTDAKDLQMMVKEINKNTVSEQDYLSDSVYKYDAREKTISMAEDGREQYLENDDFER